MSTRATIWRRRPPGRRSWRQRFRSTPTSRSSSTPTPRCVPKPAQSEKPDDPIVGVEHRHARRTDRTRSAAAHRRLATNKTIAPLDRVRVDSTDAPADDQPGRAGRRQPELAQGRPARADAARGLHPPREDHALRSRAHPRADRPRARLGGARLLRVLRVARASHARVAVRRGGQADAGVRPLLDRARRARLDRHGARRARLRGEVLHRRGQLGSGRQQHPGLLHPGRDEVPRPGARGEARAALRDAAGRVGARHLLGLRRR